MKRKEKIITGILGIIIMTLSIFSIIYEQNKKISLSSNISSTAKIIHIKLLSKEPVDNDHSTFWMGTGYVNFYHKDSSVYGKEINNVNYAVNLRQEETLSTFEDENKHIRTNISLKKYYNFCYADYLEIFDKIKLNKINILNLSRTIILNKNDLEKIYPAHKKSKPISWYFEAIHLVDDPMTSLKITVDGQGRPIMVAAAAKSKPNYYRKLYKLAYDNNILAYNIGFHRMLKSIENTPEPPEPMDD